MGGWIVTLAFKEIHMIFVIFEFYSNNDVVDPVFIAIWHMVFQYILLLLFDE